MQKAEPSRAIVGREQFDGGYRGCHRQRVSVVGTGNHHAAGWIRIVDQVHDLPTSSKNADRVAIRRRFCPSAQVTGDTTDRLVSPQRVTEPGLDLIKNEHETERIGQAAFRAYNCSDFSFIQVMIDLVKSRRCGGMIAKGEERRAATKSTAGGGRKITSDALPTAISSPHAQDHHDRHHGQRHTEPGPAMQLFLPAEMRRQAIENDDGATEDREKNDCRKAGQGLKN